MASLNETHDPSLRSWVESANAGTGFPIQNLPFASFRRAGSNESFHLGVAIGDQVLDLSVARTQLGGDWHGALGHSTLNALMALGPEAASALRLAISRALRKGSDFAGALRGALVAASGVEFALPATIGDYTDFYTSIHHATNIGRLFRPDNPLLPNYKWIPIGYHGRASTINVSGTDFHRPRGQTLPAGADRPTFGPSKRLDYELELGIYVGEGNRQGKTIPLEEAERHIFGISLLNDWSARDIQAWEYQPLGPFLSKNFATTVSPWVVTLEALAPFRRPWARPVEDGEPLAYLVSDGARAEGGIDIRLETLLETKRMADAREAPHRLGLTSYRYAYWTASQLVAHHTVNGCRLAPGDLLGSGTLSGPSVEELGSLAEITQGGKRSIALPNGEARTFLEDYDRIVFRGWCEAPGAARISFGEVAARVLPAVA
jgi:fumarylacetoacetase